MSMRESFSLIFGLDGYWDWSERRVARRKRQESGYTSFRVTKDTARQLQLLAVRLASAHPGWSYGNKIPIDELLAAIAAGTVSIAPALQSEKHAKSQLEKSMQTPPAGKACKAPIGEMHASQLPASSIVRRRDR